MLNRKNLFRKLGLNVKTLQRLNPILWAVDKYLSIAVLPKNTIIVTGERRSGNHACIYWIISCFVESDVLTAGAYRGAGLRVFDEHGVAFINDVTNIKMGLRRFLFKNRSAIRNSRLLVISLEDIAFSKFKNYGVLHLFPLVRVERSLQNVLASRYESLNRFSQAGYANGNFNIDNSFYARWLEWKSVLRRPPCSHKGKILSWKYEEWAISSEYRNEFLSSINLGCDIYPLQASAEGGGSSFGKAQPTGGRLCSVSLQPQFRRMIEHSMKQHRECFEQAELHEVERYLNNVDCK